MSDLVERLRLLYAREDDWDEWVIEAADAIERLTAERDRLAKRLDQAILTIAYLCTHQTDGWADSRATPPPESVELVLAFCVGTGAPDGVSFARAEYVREFPHEYPYWMAIPNPPSQAAESESAAHAALAQEKRDG